MWQPEIKTYLCINYDRQEPPYKERTRRAHVVRRDIKVHRPAGRRTDPAGADIRGAQQVRRRADRPLRHGNHRCAQPYHGHVRFAHQSRPARERRQGHLGAILRRGQRQAAVLDSHDKALVCHDRHRRHAPLRHSRRRGEQAVLRRFAAPPFSAVHLSRRPFHGYLRRRSGDSQGHAPAMATCIGLCVGHILLADSHGSFLCHSWHPRHPVGASGILRCPAHHRSLHNTQALSVEAPGFYIVSSQGRQGSARPGCILYLSRAGRFGRGDARSFLHIPRLSGRCGAVCLRLCDMRDIYAHCLRRHGRRILPAALRHRQ